MSETFTPPRPLNTAVLFLVFNRPDTTARVLEAIRQAKPPRLYVAADGPREGRAGEYERVARVREIATAVDWPCEVRTLFRDKNLGCKYAVSGAITWFFEQEEQGIILEDDCLPSQSFFWFCEELLIHYRYDMRISMVSGYNNKGIYGASDYFYSNIGSIWGWASWRSAWAPYDVEVTSLRKKYGDDLFRLRDLLGAKIAANRQQHWMALEKGLDTWDYQWSFVRHFNNGLSCVPRYNLVENIGFGEGATHTKARQRSAPRFEIDFPLNENVCYIPDRTYDENIHSSDSTFTKLKSLTAHTLRRLYA